MQGLLVSLHSLSPGKQARGAGRRIELEMLSHPTTPQNMQIRSADAAVRDLDVHIRLLLLLRLEGLVLHQRGGVGGHPPVEAVPVALSSLAAVDAVGSREPMTLFVFRVQG